VVSFSRRDELFEKTLQTFKWNDYYKHAHEPVHHVAYLFAYASKPWLRQKWARIVMDHAYGAVVQGLCGNEDVGQMSAFSSLQFTICNSLPGLSPGELQIADCKL
jgi:putative alpha-1,2-mannosidase